MSDMRDRETTERNIGTSTLTIEIGDINNHEHKSGHKEIFVYKYDFKGKSLLEHAKSVISILQKIQETAEKWRRVYCLMLFCISRV